MTSVLHRTWYGGLHTSFLGKEGMAMTTMREVQNGSVRI